MNECEAYVSANIAMRLSVTVDKTIRSTQVFETHQANTRLNSAYWYKDFIPANDVVQKRT